MAEPTSFPNAAETKVVPDAPSKLDEMIASYLQPGDAVTDSQIDRSLANIAAEAKPASTPTTSPAATLPEPKAESHPGSLLTWAQKLGISKEEVDSTPTEKLWETVKWMHQLESLHGDQTQRQPAVTAEAKPEAAKGEIDFGPKGDELFDADVKAALTHGIKSFIAASIEEHMKTMKEEVGGVKQFLVNQAASAHHNAIDSFFSKLPPELQAVFGAGSRADLDPKSAEIRRRRAVIQDAQGAGGDFWKALDASARTMFGGVAPAVEPAAKPREANGRFKTPSEAEEWERAALAVPTNRKSPPEPKGEDRAAKAIHDLVKSSGRSVNGNARLEDFPD